MSECIDKDCMRAGSADAGSCADCQCVWLEQECEELRAERDRLRDALTKAQDVLPGLITDEDSPVDRRAQRALDAIDAALKGDTQ